MLSHSKSTGEKDRRAHGFARAIIDAAAKGARVVALALLALIPTLAVAADGPAPADQIPQEKLDSLLAPIALYPDQLLTQTLMAATYPLDIVSAARFVEANKDLKGDALDKAIAEKNWDPSVQSLAAYPQVLLMMNDKLDWTQELGDAFLAEKARVMQTVQTLRQKAYESGNLKSNEQQKVTKQETVIIVEPATQVVYVPTYNPTVVYGTWWAPAYPPYYYPPPPYYYPGTVAAAGLIGFGIGVAVANNHWGWCNSDWHGGDVDIDVNRNNTFVNNNREFKNKVNNGKWNHNPSQRKGVAYGNARTRDQYRRSDPGAVSSRRDARGFDNRDGAGRDRGNSNRGRDDGLGGNNNRGRNDGLGGRNDDRGRNDGAGRNDSIGRDDSRDGIGTRDSQRQRDTASTRDRQQGRDNYGNRSGGQSSFDSRQSRQQTQDFSRRGASSRSQMGGRSGGGRRR